MKIKVKFVSFLRELSGVDKAELCLPQDATAKDAMEKVVYDFPKLKKWLPQYIWMFINGDYAKPQTQLKDNDEIALFPPVGGG
jgi:molybdopterin synthase catalytic subunit